MDPMFKIHPAHRFASKDEAQAECNRRTRNEPNESHTAWIVCTDIHYPGEYIVTPYRLAM